MSKDKSEPTADEDGGPWRDIPTPRSGGGMVAPDPLDRIPVASKFGGKSTLTVREWLNADNRRPDFRYRSAVRDILANAMLAASPTRPKDERIAELVEAGSRLATCAFNLAQRAHLTTNERLSLDESRKQWDAALANQKQESGNATA